MPFYEVIVSPQEPDEPAFLFINAGVGVLLSAIRFLRLRAENGEIPGVSSVEVYDEVTISGVMLQELLVHLSTRHRRLVLDESSTQRISEAEQYRVYLSEV